MAYYNDLGGLYLACDDNAGLPKFIDPLLESDGVTMGLGHFPGTRGPGEYKLPYNVVLGTFHGDWYAAAEIYRDWASKQSFCATKLRDRKDIPQWITDSPIGIMFPMRGQADWDPPATPAFHVAVARATHNPILESVITSFNALMSKTGELLEKDVGRSYRTQEYASHRALLRVLKKRDPEAARKAMSDHVQQTLVDLERILKTRQAGRRAVTSRLDGHR
jgi:hypothetical protein